jgi:3-oxoacyl-[acyl-carrier protein] reductase
MSGLLDGKVCVVTGGTRGIGQAISKAFFDEGARVIAVYAHREPEFGWADDAETKRDISDICFDVSDSKAVRDGLMDIKRSYGGLDIVVNNAGVEHNGLIGMIDEAQMREMIDVNICGTIFMTQYASRIMRRSKNGGSIVNIASGVGLRGNAGQAVYSATKGAVVAFTRSAAKELATNGIRVNAVAPGITATEMVAKTNDDALDGRVANVALKRMAKPEEIANACLYLASDMASYVSGHVLVVDGCASI